MNREIKFRAWDNVERRFWYFTLQEVLERRESYRGNFDETILREEKMQFSGLRDKSDKKNEVYEGDIVEQFGWQGEYYIVEFIDCAFYAVLINNNVPKCLRTKYIKLDALYDFQVIGNRYDNLELLNERR